MRNYRQKWYTFELDRHIVIIPSPDDKPHGKVSSRKARKYEITDATALTCACGPSVETGGTDDTGEACLWTKIHVVHHSFRDAEKIKMSLRNLGIVSP